MRIALLIPKDINTHSQYVIFIAFPLVARTRLNVMFYVHCLSLLHTIPFRFADTSETLEPKFLVVCTALYFTLKMFTSRGHPQPFLIFVKKKSGQILDNIKMAPNVSLLTLPSATFTFTMPFTAA